MRVLAVTNLYPSSRDDAVGVFVKEQLDSVARLGVDVRVLHVDRNAGGRGAYRGLGARVAAELRASPPDVVHVMYGGVMARAVAGSRGSVPLVISFCGSDLFGLDDAPWPQRMSARYGVYCSHGAARRADLIVVKSQALLDSLPGYVDRGRVVKLPNGIDLARFVPLDPVECRAALGWDPRQKHVLFPSSPRRREKRFWLAEAAVEALRARIAADVELHALDGVSRADVPTWLNASDVVLLTSAHEGSPNAVKEALACNIPVVSVDVGDVGERIAGVAGCHIAEATADDLAARLELAIFVGRVEGRGAVETLSQTRVAERLRELYEGVRRRAA
jgi:glycosyltransferase involved in cell wall biosynthesis